MAEIPVGEELNREVPMIYHVALDPNLEVAAVEFVAAWNAGEYAGGPRRPWPKAPGVVFDAGGQPDLHYGGGRRSHHRRRAEIFGQYED